MVVAAKEGAVKEEDVADAAAAANLDGTSAKAEAEPAASSAPAAAPEKAAVKPDEAPARVRGPLGCCLQGLSNPKNALVLVPFCVPS